MKDWMDIDIEGTIRDFEFTRRAVVNWNKATMSEEFFGDEYNITYDFLIKEIQQLSFKDYLKRYVYQMAELDVPFQKVTEDVYIRIIRESFVMNNTPFSFVPTTARTNMIIKKWLTNNTIHRSTVFLLGFGLAMEENEVSAFLQKVLREMDYDMDDPFEVICRYCYLTGADYNKAMELMSYYEKLDYKNGFTYVEYQNWEDMLHEENFLKNHETYFKKYLSGLKINITRENRKDQNFREFIRLYNQTQMVIALTDQEDYTGTEKMQERSPEDITPADIENAIYSGVPKNSSGNLEKMSASTLCSHFEKRRLSRQRIEDILKRRTEVSRFDILTLLFYIFAETVDKDNAILRCEKYQKEANRILEKCHMMTLYPPNPYDAFLMLCLYADEALDVYSEVWQMSYNK